MGNGSASGGFRQSNVEAEATLPPRITWNIQRESLSRLGPSAIRRLDSSVAVLARYEVLVVDCSHVTLSAATYF